jgi:hypothetical protein
MCWLIGGFCSWSRLNFLLSCCCLCWIALLGWNGVEFYFWSGLGYAGKGWLGCWGWFWSWFCFFGGVIFFDGSFYFCQFLYFYILWIHFYYLSKDFFIFECFLLARLKIFIWFCGGKWVLLFVNVFLVFRRFNATNQWF